MVRTNGNLTATPEELQRAKQEISQLMRTTEYGGPFESIEAAILKEFSHKTSDYGTDIEEGFIIPKFESKLCGREQTEHNKITKRIHFIRHAQGYHNAASHEWWQKPEVLRGPRPCSLAGDPEYAYLDATLTADGEKQAIYLQDYIVENCNTCTLLVLSPMRRATQTGLLAFTKEMKNVRPNTISPLKIVVKEEAQEHSDLMTSNKRLNVTDLKKFFYETHAENYGDILTEAGLRMDYSDVSESDPYWYNYLDTDDEESRLSVAKRGCKLLKWVYEMSDTEIVIVAHGGFFIALFETVLSKTNVTKSYWGNGEITSCDVTFNLL